MKHGAAERLLSPLLDYFSPCFRRVHEVPHVVIGDDDSARLLGEVEQEPGRWMRT